MHQFKLARSPLVIRWHNAAWREHTEASAALAASAADKGRAVVLRMQNCLLAAALASWRQHAQRIRCLRSVLLRIQQRELSAALHSWRDWVACMQRARQLMWRHLAATQQWAFAGVQLGMQKWTRATWKGP